jgi:hypothetical protein
MMEPAPIRTGLMIEIKNLIAIETAARELFHELDYNCPLWRDNAMASGEGTDGVNRAWRALSLALGEQQRT